MAKLHLNLLVIGFDILPAVNLVFLLTGSTQHLTLGRGTVCTTTNKTAEPADKCELRYTRPAGMSIQKGPDLQVILCQDINLARITSRRQADYREGECRIT